MKSLYSALPVIWRKKETYRLSDTFMQAPNGEVPLDLVVTVYNVNPGYNEEIVKRSETLHSYMTLVSRMREYEQCGMERSEAVSQAIKDCIADGILEDYLRNNASEVCSMLTQEWDWDAAKAVWQEEAREEGIEQGVEQGSTVVTARNMLAKGYMIEQITDVTGLPVEKSKNSRKTSASSARLRLNIRNRNDNKYHRNTALG